jgi:hypothetical protein
MDEQAAEFYRRVRAGYQEMVRVEPLRSPWSTGAEISTPCARRWEAIQGKLPRHDEAFQGNRPVVGALERMIDAGPRANHPADGGGRGKATLARRSRRG